MPQQVQGVVARSKGAPVELVDINIPDPGPNDVVGRSEPRPAVVCLLDCGVMAGLGAAMNDRECLAWGFGRGDRVRRGGRRGDAGARLAGASAIIAIDRDPKKLQWATELGATFVSERIKLDQVEEAFATMHRGEVLRSVVVL